MATSSDNAELPAHIVDINTLSERMQKQAHVEVVCALPHSSISVPKVINGRTFWIEGCRYSRGMVQHKDSGLIIKSHDCHECNGFWVMKATTPQAEQVCSNCDGPIRWSGEDSCWPDMLMVNNFVNPREKNG